MSTLRNEAVIYTFTNERQSLEDVIVTSEAGGDAGDRLRKSLLYKCDMLCHTKMAQQINEINDGDQNDGIYIDVSIIFFENHFKHVLLRELNWIKAN